MSEIETSQEADQEATAPVISFGDGLGALATKFSFRPRKLKDSEGKEIGEPLKVPTVEVTLPVPNESTLISILQSSLEGDAKKKKLILDAVYEVIRGQAKSQLEDVIEGFADQSAVRALSQGDLKFEELTLDFIASLEPARRGATPISEEEVATFFTDYSEVMVQAAGIDPKKVAAQVDLLKTPTRVKARKDLQKVLISLLNQYATSTAKLEETGMVYERLKAKLEKWNKEEDKVSVDALV